MLRLWPTGSAEAPLTNEQLEDLYAYPSGRRWLAVNFVSSIDGAVTFCDTAQGLSTAPDRIVLQLGSDLADALLVGATTAMVEGFRGAHPDESTLARRRRHGLADIAITAVVTTGNLPVDAPVITEAKVPTIVLTCTSAPESTRAAWADAGADVVVAGDQRVDLAAALDALTDRGLRHVDCEGGPHLFGDLLSAGLVDELRLTVSPMLVAGGAGRIAASRTVETTGLHLASALTEDDTLLLRYLASERPRRRRAGAAEDG